MGFTSQQFLISDSNTDANFRSWGSAISAAILAMGWAATADTGQVNWATVTSPAGGSFVYEIWKPTDALQTGATQIFLKVEYGSSTAGTKGSRIRMSLGTSTNGTGTLTGVLSQVMESTKAASAGQGNTTTFDCYFSGDTNRLGMLLWRSVPGTGTAVMFVVERTHNVDGTDSTDGVTLASFTGDNGGGTANTVQQTIVFGVAAGNASASRSYLTLWNSQNSSGAFNNNVPIAPLFPDYGKYGNPMTTAGVVHTQDVSEGCFFTSTLYAATRTYIASGNISLAWPSNCKVIMRYD